jgi:hypothetical protein
VQRCHKEKITDRFDEHIGGENEEGDRNQAQGQMFSTFVVAAPQFGGELPYHHRRRQDLDGRIEAKRNQG